MDTRSGQPIFPIGIGTWTMGGEREAIIDAVVDARHIDAMKYSLSRGQNHIDTAEMYGNGHTDELVAEAIKDFPREELFIANKLWQQSLGAQETPDGVYRMLDRLGTDYIDLLYIHSTFDNDEYKNAVEPINKLIDEGTVRYFGVSNFTVDDMKVASRLSTAPIAANQVEYNVTFREDADSQFVSYCRDNEIRLVAYKPIDRGAVMGNSVVQSIAKTHNATPVQIALAWLLEQDVEVIPKASQRKHIDENLQAASITLTSEDLEQLTNLA